MRVHADLDVTLEALEELKVDLKRPLMVLGINLDRMGMHRQDLNLAAQFRDKKLNIFSSGHEGIELNLRVSNIALQNMQLLAQVDARLQILRKVIPRDKLLNVPQALRFVLQVVIGPHNHLGLALNRLARWFLAVKVIACIVSDN